MIDNVASSYVFNQIVQEPSHILNSPSSYFDLIFTSQPNLVMEFGIYSSLHSNCHPHMSISYPPSYERTVWYYERANAELIRRAIDQFHY